MEAVGGVELEGAVEGLGTEYDYVMMVTSYLSL